MTAQPIAEAGEPAGTEGRRPGGMLREYRVEIVIGLLFLVVLYGGWVRFHYLTRESLWLDELWTWQIADKETLSDVLWESQLQKDVHPPLYFIMHYFLQKYAGDSEWLLRAPSATAGVLTIVAMFLLGRRLYSDTEGLIAAGLTAVLWFPIHYSQEARAYMMLGLFTTLSAWLWVCVMEPLCAGRRPKAWAVVGYVVTATTAAAVHYFGLLIVGFQALAAAALLARRRPKVLPLLPLAYIPLAAYYVWWWPVMRRALAIEHFWIPKPGYDAFYDYIRRLFNISDVLAWAALAVLAWTAGMMLYRASPGRRLPDDTSQDRLPFRDLLLVIWLVVPFVAVFIRSRLATPVLTNKNLIILMPAVYLLVARGVTLVPARRWVHALIGTLITTGLAVHLFVGLGYGRVIFKDQ
ncbi:MAG TPA: glycosyltransferase family 39 protein, partial [Planctomycetota bacterium]|nr:glycosyltransferase family 39 protein [Planctomycetota bacterium]